MNIINFFNKNFKIKNKESDFEILKYSDKLYIGTDKENNIVAVLISNDIGNSLSRKTKYVSLEYNIECKLSIFELPKKVHIIRCTCTEKIERDIFLELCEIVINIEHQNIFETFNILCNFFANTKELSDSELIGYYAEFFTIWFFNETLHIEKYWQSKDKMKFDFSFSEKLKLEVKATTKNQRIHHFKHEQLTLNNSDIYILSYMLRFDDDGLSLFDLLERCKPILSKQKNKYIRINYILRNTNIERLKSMKFNLEFTKQKMHFYNAIEIPKFNQFTPTGVSNAEYDCSLENIHFIETEYFIETVNNLS